MTRRAIDALDVQTITRKQWRRRRRERERELAQLGTLLFHQKRRHGRPGVPIVGYDESGQMQIYNSMTDASLALGGSVPNIFRAIKNGWTFHGIRFRKVTKQ